jgi:hypothetical protein
LTTVELSIVFEITTAVVHKTLHKWPQDRRPIGRHQSLALTVAFVEITLLREAFRPVRLMTPKELVQTANEKYDPELTEYLIHS